MRISDYREQEFFENTIFRKHNFSGTRFPEERRSRKEEEEKRHDKGRAGRGVEGGD